MSSRSSLMFLSVNGMAQSYDAAQDSPWQWSVRDRTGDSGLQAELALSERFALIRSLSG
jgi:hypothetical protein